MPSRQRSQVVSRSEALRCGPLSTSFSLKPTCSTSSAAPAWAADAWRFNFDGKPAAGEVAVTADTGYSRERGHGEQRYGQEERQDRDVAALSTTEEQHSVLY